MYSTLNNKDIKLENLTTVIHLIVKILNKYKYVGFLMDWKTFPDLKTKENYELCEELLAEIDVPKLKGDTKAIDKHITTLYDILEKRLHKDLNTDNDRGRILLEKLRKS